MNMQATRAFLQGLGLPPGDLYDLPTSSKRFPDGAQYRVDSSLDLGRVSGRLKTTPSASLGSLL